MLLPFLTDSTCANVRILCETDQAAFGPQSSLNYRLCQHRQARKSLDNHLIEIESRHELAMLIKQSETHFTRTKPYKACVLQ